MTSPSKARMVPADQPEPGFTPLPADARMDGYYISFDRTGCDPVDAILSAVAIAGKGSHNTDGWNEESTYYANRPGLPDVGPEASANDLIQKTAERSAREITAHAARPAAPSAPATPAVGAGTSGVGSGAQIAAHASGPDPDGGVEMTDAEWATFRGEAQAGAGEVGLGDALRHIASGLRENILGGWDLTRLAERGDALEQERDQWRDSAKYAVRQVERVRALADGAGSGFPYVQAADLRAIVGGAQ